MPKPLELSCLGDVRLPFTDSLSCLSWAPTFLWHLSLLFDPSTFRCTVIRHKISRTPIAVRPVADIALLSALF